jgi:hypothetical protein
MFTGINCNIVCTNNFSSFVFTFIIDTIFVSFLNFEYLATIVVINTTLVIVVIRNKEEEEE